MEISVNRTGEVASNLSRRGQEITLGEAYLPSSTRFVADF